MQSSPKLIDLETLARQAGAILRSGYGKRHQVNHKGIIDLVTEVDHLSETHLLGEIGRRFPGQTVYSEETGGLPGNGGQIWYVDPLDGTVNYAHGIPIFAVSLAFVEHGEIKLGVVYEPLRDECFIAEKGRGAWMNGQPLRVGECQTLDEALLATGFSYNIRTVAENNLDHYAYFALHSQGVRRLGAAALDLCYIACGRIDGYWELQLEAWDLAAGALIAREAGAVVTKRHGSPELLTSPCSIVAANPDLHPQILRQLNQR